jgi:hypothetical protein
MREHLLGYLLGALEPDEQESVETALDNDPALRRQMDVLDARLETLRLARQDDHPPPDLAARTCGFVSGYQQKQNEAPPVQPSTRLSPEVTTGRHWSMADLLVAAGVMIAASLLFFPAIASSRYQAHRTACQYNLQQLGTALTGFSEQHDGYLPLVPISGNRSVGGVIASMLKDEGFLLDTRCVICPASPLARNLDGWRVASLDEFDRAEGKTLAMLQRMVGGSYGYPLGYMENDQYRPIKNRQRPDFALIADAPSADLPGRRSANHGGCGQNVLFEDGHVAYIVGCRMGELGDDLFHSDRGFVEPGRHADDAVIVDSATPPVIWNVTPQR